jgi:protease I
MRKIVFIIASKNFRDEEYFVPKEILENAGFAVKTASDKNGIAIGADGGEAEVDYLVSDINPKDFDAVIFVGGPGCLKCLDKDASYSLCRKTFEAGKILGAICISPVILAKAGVLKNIKATVWTSSMDKSAIKMLFENGAVYDEKPVVINGKIITARGPEAAEKFGEKIAEGLVE